jgi:hypothetical protein
VSKERANAIDLVLGKAIALGIVFSVTYGASSLCGQVLVEQSRRESLRASVRAQTADEQEHQLSASLESITGPKAISDWAAANNFDGPPVLTAPTPAAPTLKSPTSLYVASRRP